MNSLILDNTFNTNLPVLVRNVNNFNLHFIFVQVRSHIRET